MYIYHFVENSSANPVFPNSNICFQTGTKILNTFHLIEKLQQCTIIIFSKHPTFKRKEYSYMEEESTIIRSCSGRKEPE